MDYEFEFPPINVSQFYINVYLLITAYVDLLYKSRHILHGSNITVNLFIQPVCLINYVPFLNFSCQTSQILTDIFYIFNFWILSPQYKISYMNLPLIFLYTYNIQSTPSIYYNTISPIMNIQYCSNSNLIAINNIDFFMFIIVNHLNDYTTTYICINVTTNMIRIPHIPSFISSYLNMCVLFHSLYIHTCMICCIYGNCQLCVSEISILIDLTIFPYEYTVLPVLKLCIIFDSRLLYFYCGTLLACKLLIHLCKCILIRLNMILNEKAPRKLLSNRKSLALHSLRPKNQSYIQSRLKKHFTHCLLFIYIYFLLFFSSDTFHILACCYTHISPLSIIVLLNNINFFLVNILTSMVSWHLCRTLANFVFLRNGSALAPFPDGVRVLILQGFAISLTDLEESKLCGINNEMYTIIDILNEITYTYVCHRAYQTGEMGVTIGYQTYLTTG